MSDQSNIISDDLRIIQTAVPAQDCQASDLLTAAYGAMASFIGVVRNEHYGKAVTHLNYTAQANLGLRVMKDLAHSLRAQFNPDLRIRMVHGLGLMYPGDVAISIQILSGHRRAALDACSEAIEYVKAHLPVWKEEFYADGSSEWLKGS